MNLPEAFLATLITVTEPRPKLDAAEEMPEVEMIQVEMLGTVNMQIAPTRKTRMTVPKERIPLPAKMAIFSSEVAEPFGPKSSLYLLISELRAYFCISAI